MADKISIKVDPLGEPNIRKLARALIALAQQQQANADNADTPPDPGDQASEAVS